MPAKNPITKPVTIAGDTPRALDMLPFGRVPGSTRPASWARVLPLGKLWKPGRYTATFNPEALTCTLKRVAD